MGSFTLAQLLEREDFTRRYKENRPISLQEFLYPLMQAYDSVVLKADVEIGATEQKFNLLAGRTLQQYFNQTPQVIITTPILLGTDGIRKMSKSYNNYIPINLTSREMFGKLMSIPDGLMAQYYTLLTDEALDEKMHPKEAKENLAYIITKEYRGAKEADKAKYNFDKKHVTRTAKSSIDAFLEVAETKNVAWSGASMNIVDLMALAGCAPSKSEAKRLIQQNAVRIKDEKTENFVVIKKLNFELSKREVLLQVGKRQYVRIIPK